MSTGIGENQAAIHLTVDGIDYGYFESLSGRDVKGKPLKHRPANMGPEQSIGGGTKSVDDATIARISYLEDPPVIKALMGLINRGKCVLTEQNLDSNGNRFGDSTTYTGILSEVHPPKRDSAGVGTVAMLSLVISLDEHVA